MALTARARVHARRSLLGSLANGRIQDSRPPPPPPFVHGPMHLLPWSWDGARPGHAQPSGPPSNSPFPGSAPMGPYHAPQTGPRQINRSGWQSNSHRPPCPRVVRATRAAVHDRGTRGQGWSAFPTGAGAFLIGAGVFPTGAGVFLTSAGAFLGPGDFPGGQGRGGPNRMGAAPNEPPRHTPAAVMKRPMRRPCLQPCGMLKATALTVPHCCHHDTQRAPPN